MQSTKVQSPDKYKTFLLKLHALKSPTAIHLTTVQRDLKIDTRTSGIMAKMGLIDVQKGVGRKPSKVVWKSSLDVDDALVGRLTDAIRSEQQNRKSKNNDDKALKQGRNVVELVPVVAKKVSGVVFTHPHLKAMGYRIDLRPMDVESVAIDGSTEVYQVQILEFKVEPKSGILTILGTTENGTLLLKTVIGKKAIAISHRIKTLLIENIS